MTWYSDHGLPEPDPQNIRAGPARQLGNIAGCALMICSAMVTVAIVAAIVWLVWTVL